MPILEHTSLVRLAQRNGGYAFGKERLELWQGFTKQTLRGPPARPPPAEGALKISALLEQVVPWVEAARYVNHIIFRKHFRIPKIPINTIVK